MQACWNWDTEEEEKNFLACVGLQEVSFDLPDLPD